MKSFSEYTKESQDILVESIGIVDGELVFDYNKITPGKEEISSKFGKKHKGEKFVPYAKTTETIIKHKVYSVYNAQGTNKTALLKAIKKQSNISISNEDYKQFINRTAMYMDYKLIRKNDIKVIIAPHSSSPLLFDLINNLKKRNPKVIFISKSFEKNLPDKITIDKDHPKITPDIVKYLEKEIQKAKSNGYFAMKEIKRVQMRKFISNIFKLSPDVSLKNIEGKNVMLLDDIVSSGSTTADMIRNLENYSPNKVIPVTIFKT